MTSALSLLTPRTRNGRNPRHAGGAPAARLGKGDRPLTELSRLPQKASHEGVATQINGHLPQSPSVVERFGEACGRAQKTQLERPKCKQSIAEVATQIDGLFLPLTGLRQRLEELQRPLKRADSFAHSRPRARKLSRPAPIADRLVRRPGLAQDGDNAATAGNRGLK
jgi:hypothetical protein